MNHPKTFIWAGALTAAALCAGCGGNEVVVADASPLTRAEASIGDAEQVDAAQYAAAELNTARDKLDKARMAMNDDEPAQAMRLAREAELDAELAAAIARNERMQSAVDELQASISTLRQEITRNE